MSDFSRSTSGRLMALSFGLALTGSGIATIIGLPQALVLMSASLFVPIAINIVGLAMAVEEHWFEAILAAIFLPLALFGFAVGVNVLATGHSNAGYAFVALGLGAFGLALRTRGSAPQARMHTAEQH